MLLAELDVSSLEPALRATVRHTRLALDWRRGDSKSMVITLKEISADSETPVLLRDIAQVFIDTSPMLSRNAKLATVSDRLRTMASKQRSSGHDYYSAISSTTQP